MNYLAVSQGIFTVGVIILILLGVFGGVWAGIYQSKKRVKTAMPHKDTEIDG